MTEWVSWVTMGLLSAVLIVAAIYDCRTHQVPNWLTYPAIGAGLIWWAIVGGYLPQTSGPWQALATSAACMVVAFTVFAVIFAAGALGGGDVKLMAAAAAIAGSWQFLLSAAFYTFIVAAIISVVVMIRRGLVKQTASRIFGAALMTLARTKPVLPDDSPRIPFALAICIGGLIAGAETLLGLNTPWAPNW